MALGQRIQLPGGFRFTPRANSTAAGMVSIPARRFTDAVGNPNSLLQLSPSIPINTVVPAMSISQRLPVLKAGQSATVTFQIRGRVNNAAPFTTSDITLEGATLDDAAGNAAALAFSLPSRRPLTVVNPP
jgi:hypothetical protein